MNNNIITIKVNRKEFLKAINSMFDGIIFISLKKDDKKIIVKDRTLEMRLNYEN